jgi:uncharacterized membrane protein
MASQHVGADSSAEAFEHTSLSASLFFFEEGTSLDREKGRMSIDVRETAQAIAELHAAHHAQSTTAERWVGQAVYAVSRPWFLGIVTIGVAMWVLANPILVWFGHGAFDPAPYDLLQGVLTLLAVYVSLAILAAQRRASVLADLRAQVTLEHTILTENKAAKIIELLEELRRDHPEITNRLDHQARALSVPTNTKDVADAIFQSHADIRRDGDSSD